MELMLSRCSSLLSRVAQPHWQDVRYISTTAQCWRRRTGCYKVTHDRSRPLTYEMAQQPFRIGVTKSWNSWNSSSLTDETSRTSETAVEDMFIRKFVTNTWSEIFVSEIIIKRRSNFIHIAGIISRSVLPRKIYFLQGYTEELLSRLLKRNVRMEVVSVTDEREMHFKWI